ncbi:MAG: hypothetical protein K2K83_02085 [Rikenella sp.]|nr:hypothetical protein [Rikenella sp.]
MPFSRASGLAAFYPAPGYRHANFGTLYTVGGYGCIWTSFVSGSVGYFLDFDDKWINPNNGNYHAFGFQLRCLQE